ncbi:GNAT family N-acetyltransferase [Flavobacterium caeni]|uniref:Protein N-acetyltransferase, RimJ/RimL family n=1 Tax=Flavobacterium caeni TaxID=490189 RepID=A0A1G5AJJ5_9FLAO|nr:GNAT family N-acetyltransferase [Flavobacterium caeni]SCX78033.1 Protein N-acetyltransferase, RimJ/RimL family [Flavobacterium caeni]
MRTRLESERLLFRELIASDAEAMFELDSDPDVVKYVGVQPLTHIDQTRELIAQIQRQYRENGIGRWGAFLKDTGEFIGWAGLKYIAELNGKKDNYDLGYRFLKPHWGKGYGTESVRAFIEFGFNEMKLERISAYADLENTASVKVLEKCGLQFVNTFMDEGDLCGWYEIDNPSVKK